MTKRVRRGLVLVALLLAVTFSASGDGNIWARCWGGTSTTLLPAGSRLMSAQWKGTNLWLLLRERKTDEAPESYVFKEVSTFGLIEGKMVLQEQ